MKRVRTIATWVAAFVAVVGLLASVVALWAQRTVLDADRTATAVDEALERQEVTDGLATAIVDELVTAVDLVGRVEERGTDVGGPATALAADVALWLEEQLADVFAGDRAKELVHLVVEDAHAALMRVLDDEPAVSGVTVADGAVTINLLPLVGLGLERVQERGYLDGVVLPELDRSGDPDEQRVALTAALDREVPADFGELVVYRDDALASAGTEAEAARELIEVVKRWMWAILLGTAAAVIVAIVAATDRRRTMLATAAATAVLFVIAAVMVGRVVDAAPDVADGVGAKVAISEMASSLTSSLSTTLFVVAGVTATVAIVLGVAGHRAGVSRSLRAEPTAVPANG